ncbi:unnamed protein product [Pedinophyceae sp. YPF-701]|nr:unnamed protein product [Pedinophyceae sp. YPF-701]
MSHVRESITQPQGRKGAGVPGARSVLACAGGPEDGPAGAPEAPAEVGDWPYWRSFVQTVCITVAFGQGIVPLAVTSMGASTQRGALTLAGLELAQLGVILALRPDAPSARKRGSVARAVLLGACLAVGCLGVVAIVEGVVGGPGGGITQGDEPLALSKDPVTFGAYLLAACVLAPVSEELLYRSWALDPALSGDDEVLDTWRRRAVSLAWSSALFAGIHASPRDFAGLFALGLCLGTGYLGTGGSIVVPITAHVLYNAAIVSSVVYAGTAR